MYSFWKLGFLTNEDINPIAMSWLESGLGGHAVACLASYQPKSISEIEPDLMSAFYELEINTGTTIKQQIYQIIRYYLRLMVQGVIGEYDGCSNVVHIELSYYPKVKLFERPDCDTHFANRAKKYKFPGREFSGQYFGIEKLVELNYRSDDYCTWTEEMDMQCRSEIKKTCTELLNSYYKDKYYDTNLQK